jgi:hypothetical protein
MEALQNYQEPRSNILLPKHASKAKENNRACMEKYVNKNHGTLTLCWEIDISQYGAGVWKLPETAGETEITGTQQKCNDIYS